MKRYILLLTILILLSGCATNRGVVSLQIPKANKPTRLNDESIFIKSVTDNRIFQEKPSSPDIPSLGFGGADSSSTDIKKRAIARKRNTYGKALGDILLEENQTVESIIKDSLIQSFYELGYDVIGKKDNVDAETIIVEASIEKFWAWMNPGFWAITISSEIETIITATNSQGNPKEIYVKSQGKFQTANGGNWLEVMNECQQQFNDKTKELFSAK